MRSFASALSSTSDGLPSALFHPDGRRVTVTFHHPGQTFAPKTLNAMIELQARWNEVDLRRLKLMK